MLKWAELETTSLLEVAHAANKISQKVEMAGRALSVIDLVADKYPTEQKLKESSAAIGDFIIKVKVKDLIDRAAKAEGKGNVKLASKHFTSALSELSKSSVDNNDRDAAVQKIKIELERLANSEIQ
jgi:hypothetical protein